MVCQQGVNSMVFSPKYCTPPVIAQVWNEIKTRDICNNPRKRRNNLRVLLLPRPLLRDSENIFFRQSSIRFHIHLAHELSSRSLNYTNCIGRWAAIEYGVWGDACVQRNATQRRPIIGRWKNTQGINRVRDKRNKISRPCFSNATQLSAHLY